MTQSQPPPDQPAGTEPPPQTLPSPVAATAGITARTGEEGFFDAYAAFSRTLRGWLIVYGIGGPVLLATQPALGQGLASAGCAYLVTMLFLAGVAVQIAAALMYKSAMWYAYAGECEASFQTTMRYRIAIWLTDQFWLELLLDVLAIGLFLAATSRAVTVLT